MSIYKYKALLPNGKMVEQTMQAKSDQEIANVLRGKKWKVISIKKAPKDLVLFGNKVSTMDKANFCHYMAIMLKSGLSVSESVEIIQSETSSVKMKEILGDLNNNLHQGGSISQTFSKYPQVFDDSFLALLRSGEQSGSLEKTFEYLYTQQYANHRLAKKIQGAMMYPIVIFIAMGGVGILMMTFVLPRLGEVFLKMKIDLPLPTKLLLQFGKFMGDNVVMVFISLFIFISIIMYLFKYYKTRKFILHKIANAPILKKLFEKIDLARFSRTLATLMQSGVPIQKALQISTAIFTQNKMQEVAAGFEQGLEAGKSVSQLLSAKDKAFPSLMIQTVKTGEKTGTLDENLFELADFYESELEDALKEFTAILEPVIMLVIGVAVGVMVIMIIAPIYSVLGGMQG